MKKQLTLVQNMALDKKGLYEGGGKEKASSGA